MKFVSLPGGIVGKIYFNPESARDVLKFRLGYSRIELKNFLRQRLLKLFRIYRMVQRIGRLRLYRCRLFAICRL